MLKYFALETPMRPLLPLLAPLLLAVASGVTTAWNMSGRELPLVQEEAFHKPEVALAAMSLPQVAKEGVQVWQVQVPREQLARVWSSTSADEQEAQADALLDPLALRVSRIVQVPVSSSYRDRLGASRAIVDDLLMRTGDANSEGVVHLAKLVHSWVSLTLEPKVYRVYLRAKKFAPTRAYVFVCPAGDKVDLYFAIQAPTSMTVEDP